MIDQEKRMKNKKYRSLKMFPSDIILKFKNIVLYCKNIDAKNKLDLTIVFWLFSFFRLKIKQNLIIVNFISVKF